MTIDDATPQDIHAVALYMRERDYLEFSAIYPTSSRAELADLITKRWMTFDDVIAVRDGENLPVCVGAVIETSPKVLTLAFFATEGFKEVSFALTRFIKQRLLPPMIEAGVHRVQCMSIAGYTTTHRWLETLGLSKEATFPRMGKNGETFVQFAWLP